MKKLEIVKLKVENLREVLKFLLLLVLSLLTGEVILFYQILISKVPVYMIIFNAVGLIVLYFVYIVAKFVWHEMEILMEGVDE